MAAKLLHSLADDHNPDLQKQIGCMAGVFHVFDRQQLLSGKRANQRSLLPPPSSSNSKFSNGSMDADPTNSYSRNVVKSGSKCVNEKQAEPPRPTVTSFSSSSSNSSLLSSGDIRDVIKGSIHKDSRGLSVQTKTKDHVSDPTSKHTDSPRPLQLSKSVNGKQDVAVPTDIKESLRILVRLHDGPWYYNAKELSILSYELKNRSSFTTSRDSPRFSYDGRAKNSRIKDVPRLSLDSRENEHAAAEQPRGSSSVVAKLMGLDMLPALRVSSEAQFGPFRELPIEHDDPSILEPLRGSDVGKSVCVSKSERRPCKSGDQVRKPSSKFPIEPAPWKNLESRRSSPKQASTQAERLLKGAKERFDDQTRASGSKLKENNGSTSLESSIVIMKPAKLVQKSGVPASSVIQVDDFRGIQRPRIGKLSAISTTTNDQIVRDPDRRTNSRNLRPSQTSSRLLQISKDGELNSVKNSGSISPRLQRKKLEFDKRSPNPPSDRRTNNRQSTDQSGSPGGRRHANTCSLRQNDEKLKQKNDKTRLPLKLTVDLETTRRNKQPVEIAYRESYIPAGETASDAAGDVSIGPEQPSPVSVLDSSAYIMEESLSPVKQTSLAPPKDDDVLDQIPSTMNREKLQSIDKLVQKLRLLNSTQDEPETDHIASLCKSTNPNDRYISEILITSGLLLRDLTCSGLSTFQLHPSGYPINPELFFVLEQTKASSFLTKRDPSNPEKLHRKLVFDVVNEILASKLNLVDPPPTEPWFKPERLAKKTLTAQMVLKELCSEIELLLQDKNREFSLEEEDRVLKNILKEDVTHRNEKWMDSGSDLSRIVLDIERSIFKDLVNEIIMSLSRRRINRRCRKLFTS